MEQQSNESNQKPFIEIQEISESKKERRELRRQEEERQVAMLIRKRKVKRFLRAFLMSAVLVLLIIVAIRWIARAPESEKPGEAVSIQPADHVQPGEPIPGLYLSNPPVSGWHYAEEAEWGIHNEALPDQLLIHNLEHGGIWISYKPDAPAEVIDNLKKIVGKFDRSVVLTPRSANDSMIALAAWGRLDQFNYFDEARILKFIKVFKDKIPERILID